MKLPVLFILLTCFARASVQELRKEGSIDFICAGKTYKLTIGTNRETTEPFFPEDQLQILITQGASTIEDYRYESSYGMVSADLISLNNGTFVRLVLIFNEGRGTSATATKMKILDINEGALVEQLTVPLAGYAGSGVKWEYAYRYVKETNPSSMGLILTLKDVPLAPPSVRDERYIPRLKKIEIDLGAGSIAAR